MKLIASLLLSAVLCFGQSYTAIQGTDPAPNMWVTINNMVAALYNGKVNYAGTWASTTTYKTQDMVIYNNVTYISLQLSNLNNLPPSSPSYWVALPGGNGSGSTGITTQLVDSTHLLISYFSPIGVGDSRVALSGTNTITLATGTSTADTLYIWLSSAGVLNLQTTTAYTFTCTSSCPLTVQSGTYQPDVNQVAHVPITNSNTFGTPVPDYVGGIVPKQLSCSGGISCSNGSNAWTLTPTNPLSTNGIPLARIVIGTTTSPSVLATGGGTTVTFTTTSINITGIPQNFNKLILEFWGTSTTGAAAGVPVTFNNDTGSAAYLNYSQAFLNGFTNSTGGGAGANFGLVNIGNSTAPSTAELVLPGYASTAFQKSWRYVNTGPYQVYGAGTGDGMVTGQGHWVSTAGGGTAAIISIQLGFTNPLSAGSTLTLLGAY